MQAVKKTDFGREWPPWDWHKCYSFIEYLDLSGNNLLPLNDTFMNRLHQQYPSSTYRSKHPQKYIRLYVSVKPVYSLDAHDTRTTDGQNWKPGVMSMSYRSFYRLLRAWYLYQSSYCWYDVIAGTSNITRFCVGRRALLAALNRHSMTP